MADLVQDVMERMIPELEDLQSKGIFQKDEITKIVHKRREFEYQMSRRPLRKVDCLRYIAYEQNLNGLRAMRKSKLGITKYSISDHGSIQRIHAIYNRALSKFSGDILLWLQYIEFCKKLQSNRQLSKLFSRALQLHPKNNGLWIEAASWEFSHNGNSDNARVLLQRAIRINSNSKRLWLEYFRLEMLFIQKHLARRQILGLDNVNTKTTTDNEVEEEIQIPHLEEEEANPSVVDEQSIKDIEKEESKQILFSGAIPKLVFQNAIAKMEKDIDFHLQFLDICVMFSADFAMQVAEVIFKNTLETFPQNSRAWDSYASWNTRTLQGNATPQERIQAENRSIQVYEKAVEACNSSEMWLKYVQWYEQQIVQYGNLPSSEFLHLIVHLKDLFQRIQEHQQMDVLIYLHFIDYLHRCGENADDIILEALDAFPESSTLWLCRIDQLNRFNSLTPRKRFKSNPKQQDPMEQKVIHVLRGATKKVSNEERNVIWQVLLERLLSNNSPSHVIDTTFQDALKDVASFSSNSNSNSTTKNDTLSEMELLRMQYLRWAMMAQGISEARNVYNKFFLQPMLPTVGTHQLLKYCLEIETSQLDMDVERTKLLFERTLDIFGKKDQDVWIQYIAFYRDLGKHQEANAVQWRANKVVENSAAFQQQLSLAF